MTEGGFYWQPGDQFDLYRRPGSPDWRRPQLGALGAAMAHWSLRPTEPALVSLPTGSGKTAIALAAPFIARARRTLVVVPSTELRRQTTRAFETQEILIRIGAFTGDVRPSVVEVTGRVESWSSLRAADIVVALPNSISPAHYGADPPPVDLFDLVVIDEAHHAPAPTWRAILSHFSKAHSLLLTATPYRRDGQRLPGTGVYHYPLRMAMEEGVYKAVQARVLTPASLTAREPLDAQIVAEVRRILAEPQHATSTALIRASTQARASRLADLYKAAGDLTVQVLHSGVGPNVQSSIVQNLRDGRLRAVVVVGMLGEGFDLPSLRVLAYHDKHKSLPATAQIVGRLARSNEEYPQPSVVVTVRDTDVYPELEGLVRALYEEDADWGAVLPGIIDDEIAEDIANREYTRGFAAPPPVLSLDAIQPIRRSVIREIPPGGPIGEAFATGVVPPEFGAGRVVQGATVLYSAVDTHGRTLMVVTTAVVRPRWHDDPGLDSNRYELHLMSIRQPPRANLPNLLFVNSDNFVIAREMQRALGLETATTPPDPSRLQEAFDSIERQSVSSVGVRSTYAGRGMPSYRMFVGSGVDRGLRDADTAFTSLGHAMVQATDADGSFTAGLATGKGKYWETRYAPLRVYGLFLSRLAERYWFPPASPTGQLLPQVSRGTRLLNWPEAEPLAAEFDFALIGTGWHTATGIPFERLDLRALRAGAGGDTDQLPLEVVALGQNDETAIWVGYQDTRGLVHSRGQDTLVQRGLAQSVRMSELLSDRPPTVFFIDGTTVLGGTVFDSRSRTRDLPADLLQVRPWTGVDLEAETAAKATERGIGRSVHEALEEYLISIPKRARHRWIVGNDGSGEIADYIVIETGGGERTHIGLWHAKFAHGAAPAVRVMDLQEVAAQAIKSRRWITEASFWEELAARLHGRSAPRARVVAGNAFMLDVLCGEIPRWHALSFVRRPPIAVGHIGIAQPGLSQGHLQAQFTLVAPSASAIQSRELLTVFHDSVSNIATAELFCSA